MKLSCAAWVLGMEGTWAFSGKRCVDYRANVGVGWRPSAGAGEGDNCL